MEVGLAVWVEHTGSGAALVCIVVEAGKRLSVVVRIDFAEEVGRYSGQAERLVLMQNFGRSSQDPMHQALAVLGDW